MLWCCLVPIKRLEKTRETLPKGYQYGDAAPLFVKAAPKILSLENIFDASSERHGGKNHLLTSDEFDTLILEAIGKGRAAWR